MSVTNCIIISLVTIFIVFRIAESQTPQTSLSYNYQISNQCPSSQKEEIVTLELKKTLTCAIEQGKTHQYQIEVQKGQFIHITIEQMGVDVTETLRGPNNFIRRRDFPNDIWGIELLSFIAPEKENYTLEIQANNAKIPRGPYKITFVQQSQPTKEDYAREDAEEKFMEADRLPNTKLNEKITLLEKAVSKWRESGDSYGLATGLTSLGFARAGSRDLFEKKEELLKLFNETLKIWEQFQEIPRQAQVLTLIARIYESHAMFSDAERIYLSAEQLWKSPNAPPMPEVTIAIQNNLATVEQKLGKYQEAIDAFKKAIEATRLAKNKLLEAQINNNLGSLYLELQSSALAEEYLSRAENLYEKAETSYPGWATMRLNQGLLAASNKDWSRSESYLQESLDLREKHAPSQVYIVFHAFGYVKDLQGKTDEALDYYNKALPKIPRLDNKVITLLNIGNIYYKNQNNKLAISTYKEAEALLAKIDSPSISWFIFAALGRSELQLNQSEEAIKHLKEAFEIVEKQRLLLARLDWRTKFLADSRIVYETYVEALMSFAEQTGDKQYAEQALVISERSRARTLLDQLLENNKATASQTDNSLLTQYRNLQQSLKAVEYEREQRFFNNAPPVYQESARKEAESLKLQLQELEGRIRISNKSLAGLITPPILDFNKIKQLIDKDSLVIEYLLGEQKSYYWVVSSDGLIASQKLPSRNNLSGIVTKLKKSLEEMPRRNSDYFKLAKETSEKIIDPIIINTKQKRLVFVPDGILHYIPFAALPLPNAKNPLASAAYLVLQRSVVILPSLATAIIQRERRKERTIAPKTLAIFADPVYDNNDEPHNCESNTLNLNPTATPKSVAERGDSSTTSENLLKYPRLEFSQKEMRAIISLPIQGGIFKACGYDANYQTATSQEMLQYKIIHFATHGKVNIEQPELSGLILSLFDKTGRRTPEGLLNLSEIYQLRLQADLVVLSACETATGPEIKGEGVTSLTRGFMVAGANGVIASLWKVGDNKLTSELMKNFYKNMLIRKMPPDIALQFAQKQMLLKYPNLHPYHWSAFIFQGDFQ